jgi:3-hydroxyisobutyrate dehydrogenase-like beta-hydroxyacid dehydrogenase
VDEVKENGGVSEVGLVSPGEMGTAVGAALVAGGHAVRFASEGRSEETRARAAAAGFEDVGSPAQLASRCEALLSVCPPQFALDTARAFAGFGGIYVDANAIAPATAAEVAGIVENYVDGGIIGPPPLEPDSTRLYLSGGPEAAQVAELFAGSALDARVIGEEHTAASGLKMAYAAWTKGSAALLLTVHEAAQRLGVAEELEAEWELSQPRLEERLAAAERSRTRKGWRWTPEMREIAATFEAVDLPGGFHEAAADVFDPEDRV